jgi:hypothetical protein
VQVFSFTPLPSRSKILLPPTHIFPNNTIVPNLLYFVYFAIFSVRQFLVCVQVGWILSSRLPGFTIYWQNKEQTQGTLYLLIIIYFISQYLYLGSYSCTGHVSDQGRVLLKIFLCNSLLVKLWRPFTLPVGEKNNIVCRSSKFILFIFFLVRLNCGCKMCNVCDTYDCTLTSSQTNNQSIFHTGRNRDRTKDNPVTQRSST